MASQYGDTPLGLVSSILNLAAILSRRAVLKVPRYQRPYTWSEKEVRQLIQDLWRAFHRGSTFYFIGQIVLVKATDGKLEISDGQQRLATLTMILAYVRDRLPNRAKHYQGLIMQGDQQRLLLRDDDVGFYRTYVQEPGRMKELAELPETASDSRDLMSIAARVIDDELGASARIGDGARVGDSQLDSFMSFVLRCATFNVVDADERGSAATVYNTLNDRGLELSAADNFKCDLLENSKLSNDEASKASKRWEELEDLLGRANFAVLLNWMPFILTGAPLLSPGDLGEFRAAVDRVGGVHTFLFELLPRYGAALGDIMDENVKCGPASADINRRIKMMKQVDRNWTRWSWAPAAIAFLAQHANQPERARRFFQALDRFAYACEFHAVDNRVQEKRYRDAMQNVGDDEKLHGDKGALVLTKIEHDKFIHRLNWPGRYAKPRRLLMLRLEAAMPGGSVLTLGDDAGVEHVLPQRGGPYWTSRFADPVARMEFANLLGNLILLTREQNERAGNKEFPFKRDVYFNTPGAPIHGVTKDIINIQEWTYEVIESRQERLVSMLCQDWAMVAGTDGRMPQF